MAWWLGKTASEDTVGTETTNGTRDNLEVTSEQSN